MLMWRQPPRLSREGEAERHVHQSRQGNLQREVPEARRRWLRLIQWQHGMT